MSTPKKITNPFPGLRPFESDEYRLFFGREGQSDALLERLGRSHFLAVVGTSGSGKSSLVRAGMLPALRGGMMAGTGSGWRVAVMRPGNDPFGELACALGEPDVLPGAGGGLPPAEGRAVIEATLRSGSLGLVSAVRGARLAEQEKLLVVVDQFEELFRFRAARPASSTGDDASAFVKLLLEAARQRELNIYVVLTMRSDFLGDCSQFQGLPEAINDGQYLIPRMTRDERRVAITGPVGVTRGKMTEPLVNRLLNDVGDNPDQLPILQHALMRTWDYWAAHRLDREPIGLEHYEAIGTMTDALSLHADEAWGELPDERSRRIAELLFKALTERGADNREIRRPTRLSEICAITGASPDEVRAVVEVFRREGRSFLMPPAGAPLEAETVIDISHESLIRNWVRLKEWVRDEAEAARIYRRLAEAAMAYRTGEGGLLDEVTLGWVLRWREKYQPNRAWGVRYRPEFDEAMAYLEESREAHDVALAERERQQQETIERERRELELAQRYAAQQRSAAQRLRWLLAAIGVMLVLALGTAVYALSARQTAKAAQAKAEESEKSAKAAQAKAEQATREVAEGAARLKEEKEHTDQMAAKLIDEKKKTDEALAAEQLAVGEQKKALEAQKRATEIATEAKHKAERILESFELSLERSSANALGRASFQREDYSHALKQFTTAFEIMEKELARAAGNEEARIGLSFSRVALLSTLGATQRKLGEFDATKFDEAVKSYEEAAALMSQLRTEFEQPGRGRSLNDDGRWTLFDIYHGLAHAHRDRGDHWRETAESAGGKEKNTKENYYNDFAEAENYFKKALDIQKELLKDADPSRLAGSYENLARLYRDLGKYEEAEPVYKKVLEAREKLPDKDEYVATLKEFAQFYVAQNRYADAVAQYEKVLPILEKEFAVGDISEVSDVRDLADSYSDLGEVYVGLKDEPKAKSVFQLASGLQDFALKFRRLERIKPTGDPSEDEKLAKMLDDLKLDEAFENLGDLFVRAGRYQTAEGVYMQAVAMSTTPGKESPSLFMKLAQLYRFHLKNYDEAVSNYSAAVGLLAKDPQKESQQLGDVLTQFGGLYAEELNKPAEAEQMFKEALDYVNSSPNMERAGYAALDALAGLYRKQNKTDALLEVSRRKLALAQQMLASTSPDSVAQKGWDAAAFSEAFGLCVEAIGDLSDILIKQGNTEAARPVLGILLYPDLSEDEVVDEKVLDAYARMLENNLSYLGDPAHTGESIKNIVAKRIERARAKQRQIQEIKRTVSVGAGR